MPHDSAVVFKQFRKENMETETRRNAINRFADMQWRCVELLSDYAEGNEKDLHALKGVVDQH